VDTQFWGVRPCIHGLLGAASLAFACLIGASAQAGIVTYSGQDDGASTSGPWPNSASAESSFLPAAAGFGTVYTETFEGLSLGSGPTWSLPGASVTITGPNFGAGFTGVTNETFGNLYGFNITSGGQNWLGFAGGTATFTFSSPDHSFGFYTTGVQTVFTSSLTVTFDDGTSQTLNLPINVNGGASYFGFTDTSAFSSVTITNLSNDAWGIDNVSYNYNAVPEPSTWAMLLAGFAGLGFAGYRSSRKRVAFAA
jgi:hypothetical protein